MRVSPATRPATELSAVTSSKSASSTVTSSSRPTFSIVTSAVMTLVVEAGSRRSSAFWSRRTWPVSASTRKAAGEEIAGGWSAA